MGVIHGNEATYHSLVSSGIVLVDFFATWCGPCKMLGPVLENIASNRSEVKVVKIDIDENENLARQFGIMSVPTLLLYKNGNIVGQRSGFMPQAAIEQWIEQERG